LYDHRSDPHEWHNLAAKAEYAGQKRQLAAFLPKEPSRKKIRNWAQLPESEKRILKMPAGRHSMPDPQNDVRLPRSL
jgi:hypothetical protein